MHLFNYLLQKKAKKITAHFFFLLEVFGKNLLAFIKKCDGVRVVCECVFYLIVCSSVIRKSVKNSDCCEGCKWGVVVVVL